MANAICRTPLCNSKKLEAASCSPGADRATWLAAASSKQARMVATLLLPDGDRRKRSRARPRRPPKIRPRTRSPPRAPTCELASRGPRMRPTLAAGFPPPPPQLASLARHGASRRLAAARGALCDASSSLVEAAAPEAVFAMGLVVGPGCTAAPFGIAPPPLHRRIPCRRASLKRRRC